MVNSRIKHLTAVLLVIAFSLIITGASYGQAGSAQGEKSLYERLGGLQGISLVVSDFMEVFMQDPVIMSNPRVKERKTADVAPYIQYQIVTMVCQATGGPCVYTGLDMKAAHDGLRVSESEWDRMVEIFAATLEKHNVPERETQELFDIVAPTKDDIVVAGDR
jgi:hemoglobin